MGKRSICDAGIKKLILLPKLKRIMRIVLNWIIFALLLGSWNNAYCTLSKIDITVILQDTTKVNYVDSNGLKQGLWKEYFKNGKIKSIAYYKNNQLHGVYKSFHENGKLEGLSNFVNGKGEGEQITYHENEKMSLYIKISNGKRVSFKQYDIKGKLEMEEIYDEKGSHIVTKHYTKDGVIEGHPIKP